MLEDFQSATDFHTPLSLLCTSSAEKEVGRGKCETERLFEADRRDGVLWFYLDTHCPQTGNDHTHTQKEAGVSGRRQARLNTPGSFKCVCT